MKLSVIIVNYNVCYYIEQCIDSVLKATRGIEVELFVVDNHSQDGSVAYLKKRFKNEVRFVQSIHNLGFARANNIAIRQAKGEYLLLLNPDTFVGETTIREMLTFMDAHEHAGAAGLTMYNSAGERAPESRRGMPTPVVSFLKMLGFSRRYYMSYLSWDEPARIDIVSGAFSLLRRKAIDEVGMLDEDFFMYGEDIDLSYRLLQHGWENWFVPARIVHYKGESTVKSSFRYVHVFYQAMLIFFRKHYGHLSFLVTLPIKIAIYFRALIALIQMLYTRMYRSLGFVSRKDLQPHYLFIGTPSMLDECRLLSDRMGLTASYFQEPASLLDIDCDGCNVVYDIEHFGYDAVISMAAQYHQGKCLLCTYSTKSHVLITPQEIIL